MELHGTMTAEQIAQAMAPGEDTTDLSHAGTWVLPVPDRRDDPPPSGPQAPTPTEQALLAQNARLERMLKEALSAKAPAHEPVRTDGSTWTIPNLFGGH